MLDPATLIRGGGYLGLAAIIFAESGLLVGFFLPGDSLLFTAGLLAAQNFLDIRIILPLLLAAAVLGDNVGYTFGARLGPKIFTRQDSLLFHRDHLQRAQRFFEQHGPKTIVLARFLPVVRTFAPILAGVGRMERRTFLTYNLLGGLIWTVGITLAGYFLGKVVPNLDRYLIPIVALIIVISFVPPIYHLLRDPAFRMRLRSTWQRKRDDTSS